MSARPQVFEASVNTKPFVSYSLLHNELRLAKHFLSEGAFYTEFGHREHGWIQERRRINVRQFFKVLKILKKSNQTFAGLFFSK
jgi:hypothetical protein